MCFFNIWNMFAKTCLDIVTEPAEGQRQCAAASASGAHGACNESEK